MSEINTTRPEPTPTGAESGFLRRRDLWAMFIGGVIILTLYLGLTIRDAMVSDSKPAPSTPQEVVHHLRAKMVVDSLEVQPRKANGAPWDSMDLGGNGLPDPQVTVLNHTARIRVQTVKAQDTLKADYNGPTIAVKNGDSITLRVVDVDLHFDDVIGEHRITLTRETIEKGELLLNFAQVKRLTLRFARPE